MRSFILIICSLFLLSGSLNGQETETVRDFVRHKLLAENYLQLGDFLSALKEFRLANAASDRRKDEAVNQGLFALEDSLKLRLSSYKSALQAQDARVRDLQLDNEAQQTKVRAAIAEIEKKEQEVKASFEQILALRLAVQADQERIKGNYEDALLLAFLSWQLADETNRPDIMRYFSLVVRDKYAVQLSPQGEVSDIQITKNYILLRDDTKVCLYGKDNGKQIGECQVNSGQLFANNQTLLTYDAEGGNIKQFDPLSNQTFPFAGQHAEGITGVSTKADFIMTWSRDNTAIVWDRNNQIKARLTGHEGNVYDVHYLEKLNQFVSRSSDGTVRRWNSEGQEIAVMAKDAYVYDLLLSPDEKYLAATTATGNIMVWSTTAIEALPMILSDDETVIAQIEFLQDGGTFLLSRGRNGNILCWDMVQGTYNDFAKQAHYQGFLPVLGASEIIAWDESGYIYQLASNGKVMNSWKAHDSSLIGADYDPVSKKILTTGNDLQVKMWTLAGEQQLSWNLTKSPGRQAARFLVGTEKAVLVPYFYQDRISIHRLPYQELEKLENDVPKYTEAFLQKYEIDLVF